MSNTDTLHSPLIGNLARDLTGNLLGDLAGFDPSQILGLDVGINVSIESSVTLRGDYVRQARGVSGTSHSFGQTIESRQPAYTDVINDNKVITGDTDDLLSLESPYIYGATHTWFFLVTKSSFGIPVPLPLVSGDSGATPELRSRPTVADLEFSIYDGTNLYTKTLVASTDSNLHVVAVEHNDNGQIRGWFDGNLVYDDTTNVVIAGKSIGLQAIFGTVLGGYLGKFGAMYIYSNILTETNRDLMTDFLKNQGGIT